jgi:hypothetical protein
LAASIGFYNFNVWPDMMMDLVVPTGTPGDAEKIAIQPMAMMSGQGYYQVSFVYYVIVE